MKIAVNTRLLINNKLEGIGWFIHETFSRMTKDHPEHEFHFIFDREYKSEFLFSSNVFAHIIKPQARHPLLHIIWFEYSIVKILKEIQPDIFVSPDGYLSLRSPFKQLAIIHDLNFEIHPEFMPWVDRKYYRHFFPKFAKKAARIATVSENSKKDIVKLYNIKPQRIDVIYSAAKENYLPISIQEQKKIKSKYTNGFDFFIYVGSLQKRKNISRLLIAFEQFKNESLSKVKLLIVGERKYWNTDIKKVYQTHAHQKDIIFTGNLVQDELNKIIPSAIALVYISLYEGFGVPILEAFSSEVPVISSSNSSIPEVAKDAAILVDPLNINSIAEALKMIEKDPFLQKQYIQKGKERKLLFSWDKTAKLLWNSIEKTINQKE